ncbi:hypothetical protein ACMD2_15708 [Ananas comosus]|uniref:Uncharacterized protein n=1 Tax=Ananas comosus TaxID=4615 RepID=A0A199UIJ2_ANACO|nr:hypothetical protein ACMD2_15708 [Ananas comosus]
MERGIHGLEPVVVASFPTKKFGGEYSQSEQDTHLQQDFYLYQGGVCKNRVSLRDSPDRKRSMRPLHSAAIRSSYSPTSFVPSSFQIAGPGRSVDINRIEATLETNTATDIAGEHASTLGEGGDRSLFINLPVKRAQVRIEVTLLLHMFYRKVPYPHS